MSEMMEGEISRRDLVVRGLVALSTLVVIPQSARGQETKVGMGTVLGQWGMDERLAVSAQSIAFDADKVQLADPTLVEWYGKTPADVVAGLQRWQHSVMPSQVAVRSGAFDDEYKTYLEIDNPEVVKVLRSTMDTYHQLFVPAATAVMYGKMANDNDQYPERIQVAAGEFLRMPEADGVWVYISPGWRDGQRLQVSQGMVSLLTNQDLTMTMHVGEISEMMMAAMSGDMTRRHMRGAGTPDHVLALVSGGPDSATMVAEARRMYPEARITPLYMRFGHEQDRSEMQALNYLTQRYALETLEVMDMRGVGRTLPGRVLIHSGAAIMPFGNAFVLTLALAYAARARISEIWIGMHADDARESHEYSDEYFDRIRRLAEATSPQFAPRIVTPWIGYDKVQIFRRGTELGVDYTSTWSCIRGSEKQCGICGACSARQRAFSLAGLRDETDYEERLPFATTAS